MSDTSTSTSIQTTVGLKTPSLWKVVLHNDDFTPMDFVTQILIHVFGKSHEEAEAIMMHVHNNGSANIGPFTKEVAVTKALLVKYYAEAAQHPLLAVAEEA